MWYPARRIQMHRDEQHAPDSVLIVAMFNGYPVWVKHPTRGWELPGGKVEEDEKVEDAARREVWEEAGLVVTELEWMFEYQIIVEEKPKIKWVYRTHVTDVGCRPSFSEIIDVRVFRPTPIPSQVKKMGEFSYVVKDDVYDFIYSCITANDKR